MRLSSAAHSDHPWRIHEIAPDFTLEDVWALPTPGGPDDFALLMSRVGGSRPEVGASRLGRVVWALRWKLGEIVGWDDEGTGLGGRATSLRERLPDDLRDAPAGPAFPNAPFTPVYLLDDEFAAEIANGTMHGILHIGWVADAAGGYRGQMAVLVKPNGLFGRLYMVAIKPFRYLFIYPPLIRHHARTWRELTGRSDPAHAPVTATIGWANLPADVRSRSSIDNPDYADLFTIDTDVGAGAEQWARAMLGDVASPLERLLWRGILGLRVERTRSRDLVAGWRLAARWNDGIRLETESPSFTCNLVITARDGRVSLATVIRYDRPLRSRIWPALSAVHRRLAPGLLRDAAVKL